MCVIIKTPSSVQNCHEVNQSWTLPITIFYRKFNPCFRIGPPVRCVFLWMCSMYMICRWPHSERWHLCFPPCIILMSAFHFAWWACLKLKRHVEFTCLGKCDGIRYIPFPNVAKKRAKREQRYQWTPQLHKLKHFNTTILKRLSVLDRYIIYFLCFLEHFETFWLSETI